MKKLMFIPALWVFGFSDAQDTSKSVAVLSQATVYLGYGAELVHHSSVKVDPAVRTIVISGIAKNPDQNSLQLSCPESLTILSHQFQVVTPTAPVMAVSPQAMQLQDSITILQKELKRLDNLIVIEQETLAKTGLLIETTISTSGNKTINSADVVKLVDYYNSKIEKCKTAIFLAQEKKEGLHAKISGLMTRIREGVPQYQANEKSYGQLTLQVMARTTGEIPFVISYYTPNAGWTAFYDIRVNTKTNKVKMVYKASLTQSTGVDWKKTKLTLSTGTPSFSMAAPELSPWYLQLYVPAIYQELKNKAALNLEDKKNKDLMALDEVVVVASQSKFTGAASNIDPVTLQKYTTIKQGELNNNYEIDLPYDIASDGQLYSVAIKEQEVETSLKNYAVPRVLSESFLLAEIADWQQLDLLPGSANIIMDETYVGKTVIDPYSTSDTLRLSLGKDKRVSIARQLVKEMSGLKTSGANSKQTYTYEITVKNNKLTDVTMVLKDQFPLSNTKEIEVKLDEPGTAEINEETGVLTWNLVLKPGESRKFRFSYSIKFPKGQRIANGK